MHNRSRGSIAFVQKFLFVKECSGRRDAVVQGELIFAKGCRESKGVCVFDSKGRQAASVLAFKLFGFLVRSQKLGVELFGFAAWLFGFLARSQKAKKLGFVAWRR